MLVSEKGRVRQVTLRVPDRLLRDARRSASRRRMSLNALLRELLERLAEEDRQAVLRNAYEALGADRDTGVERFVGAQREVLDRG
jgi:hypothetical protein